MILAERHMNQLDHGGPIINACVGFQWPAFNQPRFPWLDGTRSTASDDSRAGLRLYIRSNATCTIPYRCCLTASPPPHRCCLIATPPTCVASFSPSSLKTTCQWLTQPCRQRKPEQSCWNVKHLVFEPFDRILHTPSAKTAMDWVRCGPFKSLLWLRRSTCRRKPVSAMTWSHASKKALAQSISIEAKFRATMEAAIDPDCLPVSYHYVSALQTIACLEAGIAMSH